MALLDDVRTQLRISTQDDGIDSEITDLIDACKKDLEKVGIYSPDESDALVKRAIILYCKANFGYDNPEAERFQASYESLKNELSMSSDYAYYKVTIEAGEQCQVTFNGEKKETDDAGQVIFYIREKNHAPYIIGDSDTAYIDIKSDTIIQAGG